MTDAQPAYEAQTIYPLLQSTLHATLSNLNDEGIRSRIMMFACDADLRRFYFLTHVSTTKVGELAKDPSAAACVLASGEKLDDSSETSVVGRVSMHGELEDPTVKRGLELLAAKSSQVTNLLESGSMEGYKLLVLTAKSVTFRTYRDALENVPATVLRF